MNGRIIFVCAALAAGCAGAQQVYRCGNSYGSQPCPGGAEVSVAASPDERDAARARAAARVDAERAAALEKARVAQERQAPKAIVMAPVRAVDTAPAQAAEPAAKGNRSTGRDSKKPGHFTAVAPGTARKK